MPHLDRTLKGDLSHDTFDHGRLALSVSAYKGYFLTSLDREVDMFEDHTIIHLLCLFAYHWIVSAALRTGEFEVQGRIVDFVYLDGYHLFELAQTLLYLYGLGGLITESVYELAYISYLALLVLIGS